MATETTTPGTEGAAPTPVTPPTTPPVTPPETPPSADPPKASDGKTNTDEKTLTQAEFDNGVKARLDRAEKQWAEKLAAEQKEKQELADFKRTAEEEKAKLESEKAEREKQRLLEKGEFEKAMEIERKQANDAIKKERDHVTELESKFQAAEQRRQKSLVDTTLLAEASKKSKWANHVVTLIRNDHTFNVDSSDNIVIDGDPSKTIDMVVGTFLNQNPQLVDPAFGNREGGGSTAPTAAPATSTTTFTPKQLEDPAFIRAHEKEIVAFLREQKSQLGA